MSAGHPESDHFGVEKPGISSPESPLLPLTPLRRRTSRGSSSFKPLFAELGPRKRIGLPTLLPVLFIFVCCIALPITILAYLLSRPVVSPAPEDAHMFKGAVVAVEGSVLSEADMSDSGAIQQSTLYGLAIASITSHLISLTVPPLMGLLAYRVAADWLDETRPRPTQAKTTVPRIVTPLQYGILLKIYGSSNIFSFIQSGRYLFRQRRSANPQSRIVSSFTCLGIVLLFTHAIGFTDLWLHTVSGSLIYTSVSPIDQNTLSSMTYGTAINTTTCPYPGYTQTHHVMADEPALPGENCAAFDNNDAQWYQYGPGWGSQSDTSILAESIAVSNNASTSHSTIFIESHNMAIFVPPSISQAPISLYNFSASTLGASISCGLPSCKNLLPSPGGVDGGPFACTDFVPPYNASLFNSTSFLYDPNNLAQKPEWSNGTGTNPFGFFLQMTYSGLNTALETSGTNASSTTGTPGWYYGPLQSSVAYLTACTVSIYQVELTNYNETYSVSNATLADFNTTSAMTSGFIDYMSSTYLIPQLQNALQSFVQSKSFSRELQTQLMLRSLALSAGIVQSAPVTDAFGSSQKVASRYPIAPLATFLALLFLYSLVALGIIFWTCFSASDTVVMHQSGGSSSSHSLLEMSQVRLTDSLTVVADRFRKGDGADGDGESGFMEEDRGDLDSDLRTLQINSLDMFASEDATDGVEFGLRPTARGLRFGLYRRNN
ncbi:hypothetical protein BJ138DRAFT_1115210 [Hygrophoropsis aurantiaca]|uniref:Uncharacterized protein n=1 Tax=Hygrophoropsis aurantiaca TaxID=72124 RepID=A0ACB8A842_9AGAM|nr:hypothetical protein BJ138DRAFT_1115210 [Hygrophoropsis aurantiaca]